MARAVMKNGHSRPLEGQHDNDRLAIPFTGRSGDHERAWNDEPIDIDLPPNPNAKHLCRFRCLSAFPIDMPLDVVHETGMAHAPEEEVLDQIA